MDERPQSGELLPARSLEQIGEELLEATVRFERLVVEGGLAMGRAPARGEGPGRPRRVVAVAVEVLALDAPARAEADATGARGAPDANEFAFARGAAPDLRREQGRLVAVVPEPPDRLEQATAVRRAQADLLFWSFIEDVCLDWGDSTPPAWLTSRAAEQIARRSRELEEAGVPLAEASRWAPPGPRSAARRVAQAIHVGRRGLEALVESGTLDTGVGAMTGEEREGLLREGLELHRQWMAVRAALRGGG